jgi:hypothetical protein
MAACSRGGADYAASAKRAADYPIFDSIIEIGIYPTGAWKGLNMAVTGSFWRKVSHFEADGLHILAVSVGNLLLSAAGFMGRLEP